MMKQIYLLYNFKYHSFYNFVLACLFFPGSLKQMTVVLISESVRGPERVYSLSFRIKGMNPEDP